MKVKQEIKIRVERDFPGEGRVPAKAYYGIQTAQAVENFPISGLGEDCEMIRAMSGQRNPSRGKSGSARS